MFWGYTCSALFGLFDAFVPCLAFLPGCEFASRTGVDALYPSPWIHLKRWKSWMRMKLSPLTTYPQLVGDTLPNTDLTNCWPPTTTPLPNCGQRDGNEIFWCCFYVFISCNVFGQRRSALAQARWGRWLELLWAPVALPVCLFIHPLPLSGLTCYTFQAYLIVILLINSSRRKCLLCVAQKGTQLLFRTGKNWSYRQRPHLRWPVKFKRKTLTCTNNSMDHHTKQMTSKESEFFGGL